MTCVVKHKSKGELRQCIGSKLKYKDAPLYPEFIRTGAFLVRGTDKDGNLFWATIVNSGGLIKKVL